jgi:hypothetical protein
MAGARRGGPSAARGSRRSVQIGRGLKGWAAARRRGAFFCCLGAAPIPSRRARRFVVLRAVGAARSRRSRPTPRSPRRPAAPIGSSREGVVRRSARARAEAARRRSGAAPRSARSERRARPLRAACRAPRRDGQEQGQGRQVRGVEQRRRGRRRSPCRPFRAHSRSHPARACARPAAAPRPTAARATARPPPAAAAAARSRSGTSSARSTARWGGGARRSATRGAREGSRNSGAVRAARAGGGRRGRWALTPLSLPLGPARRRAQVMEALAKIQAGEKFEQARGRGRQGQEPGRARSGAAPRPLAAQPHRARGAPRFNPTPSLPRTGRRRLQRGRRAQGRRPGVVRWGLGGVRAAAARDPVRRRGPLAVWWARAAAGPPPPGGGAGGTSNPVLSTPPPAPSPPTTRPPRAASRKRKAELVGPFADAAFRLGVGEMTSEPVKTQFGYHLILVEGRKV